MTEQQRVEMAKAQAWINEGKPCFKIYGFRWKGASPFPITTEEATTLFQSGLYTFGMNYNELRWTDEGLMFCQYSEADML